MKLLKAPGVVAYAAILLWFLLTVMTSISANAQEAVALRASDILPSIEAALMAKGAPAGAEITLADPDALFASASGEPQFDNVSYNAASGRFLVRVVGADGTPALAIAGFMRRPAEFPVLIAPLARGEKLGEDNIAWIETSDARPADFITGLDDLIGMEARRPLQAGAPLRPSDVAAPVLVKKGALVTMTYAALGLSLTHAGVAQSSGARGDLIDVKNMKSERVVKATVAGANIVSVVPPRFAAMEQE